MKLIIEQLSIETTLENFVNEWGYDLNEIEDELKDGGYYDELINIEKSEDNSLNVEITSTSFDIIDIINNIYNNEFLMVVKDVWNGQTDECEKCDGMGENEDEEECIDCEGTGGDEVLEYTAFSLEGGNIENISEISFKGGEYAKKEFLSDEQNEKFKQLCDDGILDWTDNLKYQTFYFVKKKELKESGWEKTLESFNLYDWDKYPFKSSIIQKQESDKIETEKIEVIETKKDGSIYYKRKNSDGTIDFYYIKNHQFNGHGKSYFIGGELMCEGMWKNGTRIGEWICYHSNGKIMRKIVFNNEGDIDSGQDQSWDIDGNKI